LTTVISKKPSLLKLLGLDIGSKRIGLATWNPKARLAQPLDPLHRKNKAHDLQFLKEIVIREEVEALVVGLPIGLDGQETESTRNARWWKDLLVAEIGLPTFEWDESFSTSHADDILREQGIKLRTTRAKNKKDSIAAALILEEFTQAHA
jgi:putative Holliday junction resolvase